MPWPPTAYPLPFNKQNLTPQVDDHPLTHNQIAEAINDIVARVNTNASTSSSGDQSLQSTLNALTARVAADEADLSSHESQSWSTVTLNLEQVRDQGGGFFYRYTGQLVANVMVRHGIAYVISSGNITNDTSASVNGPASAVAIDATQLPTPRFAHTRYMLGMGYMTSQNSALQNDVIGLMMVSLDAIYARRLATNEQVGLEVGGTEWVLRDGEMFRFNLQYPTTQADT